MCRRNMILVCGNGSTTQTYPWECSETSCASVFENTIGRHYCLRYMLMIVDTQYCNMECYFQSKLVVSNPSTPDSPLTIYSDNSNIITCSWFVCCSSPYFFSCVLFIFFCFYLSTPLQVHTMISPLLLAVKENPFRYFQLLTV